MELILKAKDIRVEFKGRTCLDIDELVSLTNSTQNRKAMRRKLSGCRIVKAEPYARCRRKTPLGLRAKRLSRSRVQPLPS